MMVGAAFGLRLGASALYLAADGSRAGAVERAARFATEAEAERRVIELRATGAAFVLPWNAVPLTVRGVV